jgi:predicted alpha/beta-fold hydrolase
MDFIKHSQQIAKVADKLDKLAERDGYVDMATSEVTASRHGFPKLHRYYYPKNSLELVREVWVISGSKGVRERWGL